jgi:hypothetical protein
VLRNVSVDGEGDGGSYGNVGATMRAWDAVDNAFVNYFGLQRFGSSSVPTFDLGKTMLKHAWDEVRCKCGGRGGGASQSRAGAPQLACHQPSWVG